MKVAVLTTNISDTSGWAKSLTDKQLDFDVIDVSNPAWLEKCRQTDYQLLLARSPGTTNLIKQVFDERMQILADVLHKTIYPSLTEIRLHENKKYLDEWLKANDLPHPPTQVLFSMKEAREFIGKARYPLVAKQNIGSSGKGVKVLSSFEAARKLAKTTFSKGNRPRIGPNLRTASWAGKLLNAIKNKGLVKQRLSAYRAVFKEPQRYLILQDYVPHDYEWRAVVIGDSYFAHKKLVAKGMASGSLAKNYDDPPLALLDFIRDISNKHGIQSASIDLFETKSGYLINEIQTYFGQSDPYQMKVNGVPGRYRHLSGKWVFEAGDWASNQCYDLRLEHALSLFESIKKPAKP